MQDLGVQIKQFIHLQLKDGEPNAALLSNTMLYAFDLASSDDFFDYYKTLHHPEPVEDPSELPMFYAQKIVESLIQETEKNHSKEPVNENQEPEGRKEEPSVQQLEDGSVKDNNNNQPDDQSHVERPDNIEEADRKEGDKGDEVDKRNENEIQSNHQISNQNQTNDRNDLEHLDRKEERPDNDKSSDEKQVEVGSVREETHVEVEKRPEEHIQQNQHDQKSVEAENVEQVAEKHQINEEHQDVQGQEKVVEGVVESLNGEKTSDHEHKGSDSRKDIDHKEPEQQEKTSSQHKIEPGVIAGDDNLKEEHSDKQLIEANNNQEEDKKNILGDEGLGSDKNQALNEKDEYSEQAKAQNNEGGQDHPDSVAEERSALHENQLEKRSKEPSLQNIQAIQDDNTKKAKDAESNDSNQKEKDVAEPIKGAESNQPIHKNEENHESTDPSLQKSEEASTHKAEADIKIQKKEEPTNEKSVEAVMEKKEVTVEKKEELVVHKKEESTVEDRQEQFDQKKKEPTAETKEMAADTKKGETEHQQKEDHITSKSQEIIAKEHERTELNQKDEGSVPEKKIDNKEKATKQQKDEHPSQKKVELGDQKNDKPDINDKIEPAQEEESKKKIEYREENPKNLDKKDEEISHKKDELTVQVKEETTNVHKGELTTQPESSVNQNNTKSQQHAQVQPNKVDQADPKSSTKEDDENLKEKQEVILAKLKAQEEAEAARLKKIREEEEEAEARRKKILDDEEQKRKKEENEAAARLKKLEEEELALKKKIEADEQAASELAKQRLKEEENAKKKLQDAEADAKRLQNEALLEAHSKNEEADLEAKRKRDAAESEAKLKREEAEAEAARRKKEAEDDILRKKEEFDKLQKQRLEESEKLAKLKKEEADREAKRKQDEAEQNAIRIKKEAEAEAARKRHEANLAAERAKEDAKAQALQRKQEAEAEAKRIKDAATAEASKIREQALAQAKAQIEKMEKEAQKRKAVVDRKTQTKKPEKKSTQPAQKEDRTKALAQDNNKKPSQVNQNDDCSAENRGITGDSFGLNSQSVEKRPSRSQFSKLALHDNQKTTHDTTHETPQFTAGSGDGAVHQDTESQDKSSKNSETQEFKSFAIGSQFVNDRKIAPFDSKKNEQNNKVGVSSKTQRVQSKIVVAKPAKERRIQTSQDSRVGIRGNSKINNLVGEQGKENAINGNTNHQAERSVERDKQKFNGLRISTPTGFGAGTKAFSRTLNNYRPNATTSVSQQLKNDHFEAEFSQTAEEKKPTTANMSGVITPFGGERKVKTPNNDFYPSARFPKHVEPLPARNRENANVDVKPKSGNDAKPKTREKLAPLDKGLLREADPFALHTVKNSETSEDLLRDNLAFKKRGSEFKFQNIKSPNAGADLSNPYNANWTKWVLRHHFDVLMETADDNHGFKWKIRKIKNMGQKKSPERHHQDDKADQGSVTVPNSRGYTVSGGNKRPGKKKFFLSNSAKAFTNIEDLPLGTTDFISARAFLNSANLNMFEQNDSSKFGPDWLAETFAAISGTAIPLKNRKEARLIASQSEKRMKKGFEIKSPRFEVQAVAELPLFHPKFLTNLEELKQISVIKHQLLENQPILLLGSPSTTKGASHAQAKKVKALEV